MTPASRAFADVRREQILRSRQQMVAAPAASPPWRSIQSGEMPPLMFQLRLLSGELICYPYSDLREVRCKDAGCIQLGLHGIMPLLITFEGRHLRDLAELLSCGLVNWIQEQSDREDHDPETAPRISQIRIEKYPK